MHLKSLQLHGFKSFADKTTFEFHPGVTAIVGPNGCGKSNVVDAIRWALGETSAKALRGGEMADVIFNGTDKRQPVGMAEVTLTLTECESALGTDFNEIGISRRVFRDGRSEYRINNQLCRLRDINDLLMDTGMGQMAYSIMEQGKIDLLLSSKPEDRRAVFEEAAGITRYKSQKREALRKLDYTDANLVRIADIIAEVERQRNSLQRQAAKARRYQDLLGDVRTLDTHLSHRRFGELEAVRSELETSVASLRKEQDALQNAIATAETEIGTARTAFQEVEEQISAARQRGNELANRIHSAGSRIEFNRERTEELESLIAQNDGDIRATRDKLAEQESALEDAEAALNQVRASIASQESQLAEHAAKTEAVRHQRQEVGAGLDQARRLAGEAENTIVSVKAQLSNSLGRIESDGHRQEQLASEIAKLQTERDSKLKEGDTLARDLDAIRKTIEEQNATLTAAEREFRSGELQLAELEQQRADNHRTLAEKSSRLEVLRQLISKGEGLQKGTQSVLKGLNNPELFSPGVRGVLTSFLEVEPDFIPPLEAALGAHLQTVLVTDTELAERIIDVLVQHKLGEVTLLPADASPPTTGSQMMTLPDGAVGWALDKVTVSPQFKPLVQRLLANVLIVRDLPSALALKRVYGDLTFATMGGELVSPDGVIRGGTSGESGAGSLLLKQNEVRQLEQETAALDEKRTTLDRGCESARSRLGDLKAGAEEARAVLHENRVRESTLDGQASLVTREIAQMGSKLEGVQWEQGELFRRVEDAENDVARLREAQAEAAAQLERRQKEIRAGEAKLAEVMRKESESAELLNELRTTLAVERRAEEALRHQREPMANRMAELGELVDRREADIRSHRDKIAAAEAECASLREAIANDNARKEEVADELRALGEERQRKDAALRSTEEALLGNRRQLGRTTEQRGNEEIKITQLDLRIENLVASVSERYGVDLQTFEPDTHILLSAIADQKKIHQRTLKRRATLASQNIDENDPGEPGDATGHDDRQTTPEAPDDDANDDADALESFPDEDEGPDWAFVEAVVGELRRKLDSMGPVNLDAIEEFEELEERHAFLHRQHGDLVNSKEELLRVIAKINRTTKEMFAETFAKVRENFRQTFRELFGQGARSDLILVDEDDPLESGIEIIARPPGKKPTSISLLSGGERSMTAVALLFSIYRVKPSPFCVLDELDAPLDESNIGRFLTMLDQFIEQSQFLIVTHNKRTMNRADILYGVTQGEFGVSKLVGMKLTPHRENGRPAPAGETALPA